MEFVPDEAQLRIFLVLLCVSLSSSERLPWLWSRESLSEAEKPCGSLIRPREGGQRPEVFRFRLDESPSVSFWKRANEVEDSVRGECAVAIIAPKGSSRLAVGVDLAAVEVDGEGQCLLGNHIALYDLQGGRLILKDTICGWQKAVALMESTSNMALLTINLRGVKKGSFLLKVSVLREGEYLTTTEGNFWVPPTTTTPEKYQEHTEVFLVPDTTENPLSSEEQTTESIAGTTKGEEATTSETTTEDNEDKEITEEGYDPVKETTVAKEKGSTTKKPKDPSPENETTESMGSSEEMGMEIEGSGTGSSRTTEKPSGGSGIEFIIPSGTRDRRTTTELPGKPGGSGIEFLIPAASGEGRTTGRPGGSGIEFLIPSAPSGGRTTERPGGSGIEFLIPSAPSGGRTTERPGGSGIEFLIPSASGEGRTTGRPGGSGIVFLYPSGHGVGRTTADYHGQSSGDYVSIPWAEALKGQEDHSIPNQSMTDTNAKETPKKPLNEELIERTTPLNDLKETESLKVTGDGGSHTTLVHGNLGSSNKENLSDDNNTDGESSGTTSTPSETSSVTKPPKRPGIEFVYPGRPSFALVSDNPSLLPDFPLFPETTARPKVTPSSPQDSGIVFVFHEESTSEEQNGDSVRSLKETESSKEIGIERRILEQTSSTVPPRTWPTLSVKWRKRITTPSTESLRYIDGHEIGVRKEADSSPLFSTAMTPEYLRVNHSKIAESVTASVLKTGIGASQNSLGKKKRPLKKKGSLIGLRNSSQETITTKSQKRDPWSGIQLVIPKKIVTSSLNKVLITSSLILPHLTTPSTPAGTADGQSQRNQPTSSTLSLSTTDRSEPADRTSPSNASFITIIGKSLDAPQLQTEASA